MGAADRVRRLLMAPPDKDRGNNINLIRFVAAAAVVLGHMGVLLGVEAPRVAGQEVSTLAVKVFFLMSGYLICTSLLRDPHPGRYLARRALRIFPALVVVVVVWALVLGPLVSSLPADAYYADGHTWRYLTGCLMYMEYYLPGVFADNPYPNAVNGSLWTLPVESLMYLVLPVVLVPLRTPAARRAGAACAAGATAAVSLLHATGALSLDVVVWGTRLADAAALAPWFFIGAFVSLTPQVKRLFNVQVALLLVLLAACVHDASAWKVELLAFAWLPYATFSLALAVPALFGRVFAEHDYSYGVYLWAFPTQQTLVWLLGPGALGMFAYAALSLAATLPFAVASWFLVERPAMRWCRAIVARSKERSG